MREYRERTEPVVAYYRDAAVPVYAIDGTSGIDVVHERVVQALTGRGPSRTAP
jgi:hypothetical protein